MVCAVWRVYKNTLRLSDALQPNSKFFEKMLPLRWQNGSEGRADEAKPKLRRFFRVHGKIGGAPIADIPLNTHVTASPAPVILV